MGVGRYHPKRPKAGMTGIGKSRIVFMMIHIYNKNANMDYIHYIGQQKSSKNDGNTEY